MLRQEPEPPCRPLSDNEPFRQCYPRYKAAPLAYWEQSCLGEGEFDERVVAMEQSQRRHVGQQVSDRRKWNSNRNGPRQHPLLYSLRAEFRLKLCFQD